MRDYFRYQMTFFEHLWLVKGVLFGVWLQKLHLTIYGTILSSKQIRIGKVHLWVKFDVSGVYGTSHICEFIGHVFAILVAYVLAT